MHAWPVILALLLAGCSSPPANAPGADPDGTDLTSGTPVVLAVLDSEACDYNDLIWLMPASEVQGFLPEGFTARDNLFADGMGALVINAFDCGGAFAWNGWDLFALVQPPAMPDVVEAFDAANRTSRADGDHLELDLYSLAAHTDNEGLRHVFETAGIPVGPGVHSREGVSDSVGAASATGTLRSGTQVLGQYVTTGVIAAELGAYLTAHHRQWHVAQNGTLLIERVMIQEGGTIPITQGPGTCVLDPSTTFAAVLGVRPCQLSQDAIGGLGWAGRAYFFEGVAALP